MASFVLEVHGQGSTVAIEPVGTIDLAAARTLINEIRSVRHQPHALVEVRLGRVVAVTKSASRLLAAGDLPVHVLAA
jgi:hypothetical protein